MRGPGLIAGLSPRASYGNYIRARLGRVDVLFCAHLLACALMHRSGGASEGYVYRRSKGEEGDRRSLGILD